MKSKNIFLIGAIGLGAYYLYNKGEPQQTEQIGSGGSSGFSGKPISLKKTSQHINDIKRNTITTDIGNIPSRAVETSILNNTSQFKDDDLIILKKNNQTIGGLDFQNLQCLTPQSAKLYEENSTNPIVTMIRNSEKKSSSSSSSRSSRKKKKTHITYKKINLSKNIKIYKNDKGKTIGGEDTKRGMTLTKKTAKLYERNKDNPIAKIFTGGIL